MEQEEYIEIDLKAIFFRMLYQWKRILVVALALAAVLGVLMGVLTALPKDEDEESKLWSEIELYAYSLNAREEKLISLQDKMLSLEDRMLSLENKKRTFTEQQNAIQEKIDILLDDMDHSVLMKADYRNVYIAQATYHIDSGWKVLPGNNYQDPDMTGTLNYYYRSLMQEYHVYEAISEKVGIEPKYLMELVSIGCPTNNTVSLTVYHPYEHSALQIMELLQSALLELHDQLAQDVESHTLTMMLNTCGIYVQDWIRDMQQAHKDELLDYQLEMDDAQGILLETQNELIRTQEELILAQEDLIRAQEELEAFLEEDVPEDPNPLKEGIKWAILGGVAGGLLAAVWYAALFLFNGRIYSIGSMADRWGAPVVGRLVRETKWDPITQLLRKWDGAMLANTDENDKLVTATLHLHCKDDRVLLFSDAGAACTELAAERLREQTQLKLEPHGSLTLDAQALEALETSESVLLVITIGVSRKSEVDKAVRLIRAAGKELAGFLVLE